MGALNLPQIATSQDQKEQTSNDADSALEAASCNNSNIDLTSANNVIANDMSNPGASDFKRNISFTVQNATVGGRTVTLPAVRRVVLFVSDGTNTQNVSLILGSTTLVIAPGTNMLVRLDGTANGLFQMAFNSGPPILSTSFLGMPGAGDTLLSYIYVQNGSFPASFTGSKAKAETNATADSVLNIQKNGSSIGSITISAGTGVGVFSGAGGSFVSGDVLKIIAPNPQDVTLANLIITLKGG